MNFALVVYHARMESELNASRHGLVELVGRSVPGFRIHVAHAGAGSALREIDPFKGFPETFGRFYRFEADAEVAAKEEATDSNFIFPFALSAEDGERVLYVARHTGASSFYRPNMELLARWHYGDVLLDRVHQTLEERIVPTRSLDSLIGDGTLDDIDFLRMNIQGGELDVLDGGALAFERAVGIQIELSFDQTYIGAPLFSDIEPRLRERGFVFFDFLAPNQIAYSKQVQEGRGSERYWRFPSAQVIESHCLFLKDFRRSATDDGRKALALAALAEMYGQLSFARDMAAYAENFPDYEDVARAAVETLDRRWGVV